jgi:hypothetical protein
MNGMLPSRRYRSGLGEDGDSCAGATAAVSPGGKGDKSAGCSKALQYPKYRSREYQEME